MSRDSPTSAGQRGAEKREQALEVVTRVLGERGHDRTRLRDIAVATGVPVSTLQFYFGSREDMFVEALYGATEAEAAVLERAVAKAAAHHDDLRAHAGRSDSATDGPSSRRSPTARPRAYSIRSDRPRTSSRC